MAGDKESSKKNDEPGHESGDRGKYAELEKLSSKELHERAVRTAVRRVDVKYLWQLLKLIPAAEAAAGNIAESEADIKYVLPLIDDYLRAGDSEIADQLRPFYIRYLAEHS